MATKKATKKPSTKKTAAKPTAMPNVTSSSSAKPDDEKHYMDHQREADALEAKLGEAAKEIKRCHLLAKEATHLLAAARMSTATPEAIDHHLERVLTISHDVTKAAKEARTLLGK